MQVHTHTCTHTYTFYSWPVTVIASLTVVLPPLLSPEGTNFRNILDKAVQADQVVRDRYGTHCDMIALLCKSEDELNAAIPSANPTKTLQGSEVCLLLFHLHIDTCPVFTKLHFLVFCRLLTVYSVEYTDLLYAHTQWTLCAFSSLPTVAPYFILFADSALFSTGELRLKNLASRTGKR